MKNIKNWHINRCAMWCNNYILSDNVDDVENLTILTMLVMTHHNCQMSLSYLCPIFIKSLSNLCQIFVKSQKHHSLADWVSNMNQRVVLGKEALVFIRCSWSAKFNHVRVISNWTEFGWIIQNQLGSFGVMKLILQFSDNACLKPCIKVQNLQYKFLDWKCPPPLEFFRKFIRFGTATRP